MTRKPFGWTGVGLPVIGQGSWMLAAYDRAASALQTGLDLGMTHIDCAEMYGNEEFVGRALAGRRAEVFLVSKVLPSHASRAGVRRACEQSLRRLGTPYLDLYLLHWRGDVPLAETMAALEDLVDRGLTRFIGVSNFDVPDLEEAAAALTRHRLACNQVLYHLGDRGIEHRVIPWCEAHGIAVVGYSPFGHSGFPSPASAGGRVLSAIAARTGRTPRQVVLNFLTRPAHVFAIPKSGEPAHVRENSGGAGWELTPADLDEIGRAFPAPPPGAPLGMI